MSFYLPEYVDELIDTSSDPLCILLAREGAYDEAYQTAMYHRAGLQQVVTRALIEQRPDLDGENEGDLSVEVITRVKRTTRITRSTKKHSFN